MHLRSQATEHRAVEVIALFPPGEEADGRLPRFAEVDEFVHHAPVDDSFGESLERFGGRTTAADAIQHGGEFGVFSLALVDGEFVVRHGVGPDVDRGGTSESALHRLSGDLFKYRVSVDRL